MPASLRAWPAGTYTVKALARYGFSSYSAGSFDIAVILGQSAFWFQRPKPDQGWLLRVTFEAISRGVIKQMIGATIGWPLVPRTS